MRLRVLALLCICLLPAALRAEDPADPPHLREARERMVREQIVARGVTRPDVVAALLAVPRHRFVPPDIVESAYQDHPLPIGEGQTISQPYIVALMTEALDLKPSECVLEIGTGSGYQAAVLSALGARVFTIEIKPRLHEAAERALRLTGHAGVAGRRGDGYFGWPEAAPFDAILITAAVDHVPPPLLAQLRDGGRLVLPLGSPFGYQSLVRVTRTGSEVTVKTITGVLFVPMTGHALEKTGNR